MSENNTNPFDDLLKSQEAAYGDRYKDHLLEQYKLYVESADHISDRRSTANNFFLSVNGFLISIIGILPQLNVVPLEFSMIWLIGISAVGILFSVAWIILIQSYKKLNAAKYTIVGLMEKRLPAAPFDVEWKYLTADKKKKKRFGISERYFPLTLIESWVPGICILIYLGLIVAWWYLLQLAPKAAING